jgi:hypothetical protein
MLAVVFDRDRQLEAEGIQPLPSGQVNGPFSSGSRDAKYWIPAQADVLLVLAP